MSAETCDECGGTRYIEVLTTQYQQRQTASGSMGGNYAVRADYPCGRCWGTGLVEVAS